MAKDPFEFYCSGGCRGYTIVHLDTDIDEDIIFQCPNCTHEHMRRMKGGKVTEARHNTTREDSRVHLLEVSKAAFSKEPRLGKLQEAKGFLGNLWGRKA